MGDEKYQGIPDAPAFVSWDDALGVLQQKEALEVENKRLREMLEKQDPNTRCIRVAKAVDPLAFKTFFTSLRDGTNFFSLNRDFNSDTYTLYGPITRVQGLNGMELSGGNNVAAFNCLEKARVLLFEEFMQRFNEFTKALNDTVTQYDE